MNHIPGITKMVPAVGAQVKRGVGRLFNEATKRTRAMKHVTVTMPLALTPEMLAAVREDPTTKAEDWETWHTRLGWLICAWDVLLQARPKLGDAVPVPREALEWLMGERDEFEPADAHMPRPQGYKRPQFWWRSEFKKRAGL